MAPVRELPTVAAGSPGLKRPAPGGHFGAFAPGVGFQNRPPPAPPIATAHDKRLRPPGQLLHPDLQPLPLPRVTSREPGRAAGRLPVLVRAGDRGQRLDRRHRRDDRRLRRPPADPRLAPRHQHRRLRQLAVRAGAGGRALRRLRRRRRQHPRQPGRDRRGQDGSRSGARRGLRAVAAVRPGRAAVARPVLHRPARPAHRAQPARAAARPRPAPPHLSRDPDHSPRRPAGDDAARQRARVLRLRPCRRLPDAGRHPDPAPAVLRLDHALLRGRPARAARQQRGRARLGSLPRRPRVHDRAHRRGDRRRGALRPARADPADDRLAHGGRDPPAPRSTSATRSTPITWRCGCAASATSRCCRCR